MKYLSLFSGYGGFELGIQKAYDNRPNLWNRTANLSENLTDIEEQQNRATCVGFSEIDKYAIQTYNKNFPQHKNYGDITKINPSTLPDFDLLCGGFPCQAFSIAGKRAGFEDTRGTLIYDVFRIIKEKQPKLVLLENVKGLLSHDNGRTFKTIITSLAQLGYAVEWQVLNAKNFGVPQNRERVFIIGHLGGFGGRAIFPFGGKNETYIKEYPTICGSSQKHAAVNNGQVPCLSSAMGLGGGQIPMKFEDARIRRLTPTECERLMGLPDGWTEGVSDTQRYKLCGNGVVVNVVEEIIKKLKQNYDFSKSEN